MERLLSIFVVALLAACSSAPPDTETGGTSSALGQNENGEETGCKTAACAVLDASDEARGACAERHHACYISDGDGSENEDVHTARCHEMEVRCIAAACRAAVAQCSTIFGHSACSAAMSQCTSGDGA